MSANTSELKNIVSEVIGNEASSMLLNRLFVALEQASDLKSGAARVEKIVALFLGNDPAKALGQRFKVALG